MNDSLDPNRLTVEQAARILSSAGRKLVSVEMIQRDIEANAPTNPDGSINLVHYAAWLVRALANGS